MRSSASSGPPGRARTISCGWLGVHGYSTGRVRASTTSSPSGSPSSATSQRARSLAPVRFTPVKSELLLRLLIADLVGEEVTRESITTIRDDISELFTRVGEAEVRAAALPSRTKYLLLVHGFLRRLLDLHLEFVDDLERELAPDEPAVLE